MFLHMWVENRPHSTAAERGIKVEQVDEARLKTSKTCCACGTAADSHRVERGLYVCGSCELVANADCNAAENMRATLMRQMISKLEVKFAITLDMVG